MNDKPLSSGVRHCAFFRFFLLCALCVSCGKETGLEEISVPDAASAVKAASVASVKIDTSVTEEKFPGMDADLERIAEIERGGTFFPGLGLAESGLREKAGDFVGAALAAYKELSWAYGYGSVGKEQVEEGLNNALTLLGDSSPAGDRSRAAGTAALMACAAFAREDWKKAEELLSALPADNEPDSFLRWMLLVCAAENGGSKGRSAFRSAYGAIRARYALFPEYWYRGARAYAGGDTDVAAAYAEQCVNSSPQGPFAGDSRKILAEHLGLAPDEAFAHIRTKAEIEYVIRNSVAGNDPALLEDLYPLMSLPENPFTLYALGALKTLSAFPEFRAFFAEAAARSPGRLGERLNYISRG